MYNTVCPAWISWVLIGYLGMWKYQYQIKLFTLHATCLGSCDCVCVCVKCQRNAKDCCNVASPDIFTAPPTSHTKWEESPAWPKHSTSQLLCQLDALSSTSTLCWIDSGYFETASFNASVTATVTACADVQNDIEHTNIFRQESVRLCINYKYIKKRIKIINLCIKS